MPTQSLLKALNRALADEMERDPAVLVLGEDVRSAATNVTAGLLKRFGPDRVLDTPISEQAFTGFATGAALAGARPLIEFQIPALLFLAFEQIVNQAHKFSLMTGGQARVPVTYLIPSSGSRDGWAGQHSDHPYSMFAHAGVKTAVAATPRDAYGLLVSAIRDDDPVVLFAPAGVMGAREDLDFAQLPPVPLGRARLHRRGTDVTVVAVGHLVPEAVALADELAGGPGGGVSVEVLDPRTLHPFDWAALAESLERTGRLVVADDSNRFCGLGAEILATAAERLHLTAAPRRVTRPDGAVLPFARELDKALQPTRAQVRAAVFQVLGREDPAGPGTAVAVPEDVPQVRQKAEVSGG
jgi:pyruvate/2-oxoglutarate/acetoin dehydrogenase E1 component